MSTSTQEPTTPRRRPTGRSIALLGPAFVAAIAYVDPGNVAANLTAGAKYGYLLIWVLVLANAMAVLVQYLSAKLGLVSGRSLPEMLGQRLRKNNRRAFWLQAEMMAIATDVAEVIGGAIALNLLFNIPLFLGGLITGCVSMVILTIQSRRGQRTFEFVVMGLLAIITIGFLTGLAFTDVSGSEAVAGLVPASKEPRPYCSPPACSEQRSCRTRSTFTPHWHVIATATSNPAHGCSDYSKSPVGMSSSR